MTTQRASDTDAFIRKTNEVSEAKKNDSISVLVHNIVVAGPVTAGNLPLAKGLASERARRVLEDPRSEFSLKRLCDCTKKATKKPPQVDEEEKLRRELEEKSENPPNDETEEGFARIAELTRKEFADQELELEITLAEETMVEDELMDEMEKLTDEEDGDEMAVEEMLLLSDLDELIPDEEALIPENSSDMEISEEGTDMVISEDDM